jgi:intracellular sulfur oxidation DsrE/DsrF family protein
MIHDKRRFLAAAVVAGALVLGSSWTVPASAAEPTSKVVYHVNDADNATAALRNIQNHLNAEPGAKIVVVTHGKGIDFLLVGAEDKNKNPYEVTVQTLKNSGVEFKVCNNTLVGRKIDKSKVIPEADIVPSGVAEIGKLQYQEHYVYLKP